MYKGVCERIVECHRHVSRVVISEVTGVEYREPTAFPGYWVGSDGTVWKGESIARGSWKKIGWSCQSDNGAPMTGLVPPGERGQQMQCKVSRLVLTVFTGQTKDSRLWYVAHRDGDVTNCSYSNLYWQLRAKLKRSGRPGEDGSAPASKARQERALRSGEITQLRYLLSQGKSLPEIARRMCCSEQLLKQELRKG